MLPLSVVSAIVFALTCAQDATALPRPILNSKHLNQAVNVKVASPSTTVAKSASAGTESFWVATGSDFFFPSDYSLSSSAASSSSSSSSSSSATAPSFVYVASSSPSPLAAPSTNIGRPTPTASPTYPIYSTLTLSPSSSSALPTPIPILSNSSSALFAELHALISFGQLDPRTLPPHQLTRLNKRDTTNLIDLYLGLLESRSVNGVEPTPFLTGQRVRLSAIEAAKKSASSVSSRKAASSTTRSVQANGGATRTSSTTTTKKPTSATSTKKATSTTTKKATTTSKKTTTTSKATTTSKKATTTSKKATTTSKKAATTSKTSTTAKAKTTTTSKATTAKATTTKETTTTVPKATSTSSSSSSSSNGLTDGLTFWKEKTYFYSLASFITDVVDKANFSWGANNVAVLKTGPPATQWTKGVQKDTKPALQIAYPKGSRNPGKTPQGGVGFYSSKIDIAAATNVSFSYSVFFPTGFDFVKGGKLPGLFGGKKACSGGAAAEDCFSTRMMFRKDGMGELYLYAPREKQVDALCQLGPLSYCNSVYGMSIGRGSWTFKTGEWTDLRQDIWLNTPGEADGGFNIWVNDKLVLHSNQVYYRNSVVGNVALPGSGSGSSSSDDSAETETDLIDYDSIPNDVVIPNGGFSSYPSSSSSPSSAESSFQPSFVTKIVAPIPTSTSTAAAESGDASPTSWTNDTEARQRRARRSIAFSTSSSSPPETKAKAELDKRATKSPAGFVGAMVQTFFGGSSDDYESPTLQYSYFRGFGLSIND